ncbi:hypothetical protein F5Y06DRAFT_279299 [Hypoxylon sp. FL0890]|nr:hypothetical protein F5Y06DRAFT_279299 [Hypoxylon sp. FL0890]
MQVTRIWFILGLLVTQVVSAIAAFHQNNTASNSTVTSTGDGTAGKDFRLECDGSSMGLVQSHTRQGIYYLRGVCGGVYNDPHASRCSFLDLSMCYINDGGNIRAQRMGRLFDSCSNCVLYSSEGSNMLACTCGRGEHNGGGTQEAAVQLDDLLYVKNGFLSCYGYTNFECPYIDVPY